MQQQLEQQLEAVQQLSDLQGRLTAADAALGHAQTCAEEAQQRLEAMEGEAQTLLLDLVQAREELQVSMDDSNT